MKIKDSLFVIPAAGKGTRMGDKLNVKNKCLLKISENQTILDKIIHNLNQNDVKELLILTGHNGKDLSNSIEKIKTHRIKLHVLNANGDYEKGAIYTILTLLNILDNQKNTKLQNHNLNQDSFITVIPSDTIFNEKVLKNILSTEINDFSKEESIYIFTLRISSEMLNLYHDTYAFNGSTLKYGKKNKLHFSNLKELNYNSNDPIEILLPIITMNLKVLELAKAKLNMGITKITEFIENLNLKLAKIYKINIPWDQNNQTKPPFFDVDTQVSFLHCRNLNNLFS